MSAAVDVGPTNAPRRAKSPEPVKPVRPKIKRNRVTDPAVPSTSKTTLDLPAKPAAHSSLRPPLDLPKKPSRAERRSKKDKNGFNSADGQAAEFGADLDFIDLDSDASRDWKGSARISRPERQRTSKSKKSKEMGGAEPDIEKVTLGTGADFIRFDDADKEDAKDESKDAEPHRARSPPTRPRREREWDRGKHRQRSLDREDERRRERAKYEPRSRYSSRRIPWLSNVDFDSCHNIAEVLYQEVQAFTKWMAPTPEEDQVRGLTVQRIRNAVLSTFPDARVEPFGSYATKLYLPSGDIDLVIISDTMAYHDRVKVLHTLASTLKRAGVTDRVSIIAKARVPIVKFVTTLGLFHVDISINQANGLIGVDMINGFLSKMHGDQCVALRALVLIVKLFLSQRSMNEVYTGGLGSYAIVCLVISFLQMHPKIRSSEIDVERNVGVLVMEFFELYGCYFNYSETGISIRDGGTYFSKRQRGWYNDYKGVMLSIEDPADPSNDISAGSFGFSKVRATMAGAHSILTSTVYQKAGILHARRSGQALRLREQYDPEDLSILSSIMSIPQETLNHRRVVQEVYISRELHRLLGAQPLDSQMSAHTKADDLSSDTELAADSDSGAPATGKKRAHADSDDSDEGGRYGIPPDNKRRRVEERVMFTTDDDDDNEDSDDSEAARDYMLSSGIGGGEEGEVKRTRSKRAGRNQAYWLAKGRGPPMADDESDGQKGDGGIEEEEG